MNTVRNAIGQVIPSAGVSIAKGNEKKKFLIVVQYYDGDKAQAESLLDLIADLEKTRNTFADIMIFARADSQLTIGHSTLGRLREKFGVVHIERCRRIGAKGYPYGPNEMFYDLVNRVAYDRKFQEYFAFINLESDCVPTRPGWITDLVKDFRGACAEGMVMTGFACLNHPYPHVNGVAVYPTDLPQIIGPSRLLGGNARTPYDVALGTTLLPICRHSGQIYLDFQRPTITAEELFAVREQGTAPAIFHGVKDDSARELVRATHITLDNSKVVDNTIFTYFEDVPGMDMAAQRQQIDMWKTAWAYRGFRPVVLGLREAARHQIYSRFLKVIEALPTVNPKRYELACFLRWLALDSMGGGLMCDYDVLPNRVIPADITKVAEPTKFTFCQTNSPVPCLVQADRKALAAWIKHIIDYKIAHEDRDNGRPHVSDQSILQKAFANKAEFLKEADLVVSYGNQDWRAAPAVHFSSHAVAKTSPGQTKAAAMADFLKL